MSASGPAKLLDIKKMKASELVGLMDEGRSKFAHVSSPRYLMQRVLSCPIEKKTKLGLLVEELGGLLAQN